MLPLPFPALLKSPCLRPLGLLLAALALAGPLGARANDPLAHIFQDNMVLQRDQPAPVWGWAAAGTDVELSFAGQTKKVKADKDGYWKAVLDPMPANATNRDLTARVGGTTVTRKNVLVGEVWVATGQSNMVVGGPDQDTGVYPFYVSAGNGGGKPEVRVQTYGAGSSLEPLADSDSDGKPNPWGTLAENPPPKEMNIPPYFARVIRDTLNVPVGVIIVAVGGTNQAAWMSREALQQFPGENGGADYYASRLADLDAKLATGKAPFKSYAEFTQANDAWQKNRTGLRPGRGNLEYENFPAVLYNTRIYPLAPLAIRGMIWHQGEAGPGGPYGKRLAAMAGQWRKVFGQDFYFIWGTLGRNTVEPPPLSPLRTSFYRSGGNVEIRRATESFGKDGKATLVEFYDLGNTVTHFLEKAEAGRRMGLAALSLAYGKPGVFTGPRVVESKIEGGKATVRFDQVGAGLVYKPSIDGISGVYVRGKAGEPRWGQVKVTGKDTAEISSPEIAELATVEYAANSNPHETFFNPEGLPASPFAINPAAGNDPAATAELVSLPGKPPGVGLHVPHVRKDGYVFKLKNSAKKKAGLDADTDSDAAGGKASVQVFIPAAWHAFEVLVGGTKVEAKESTVNGKRYATFDAAVGNAWIIVAEAGKADAFRKVDRF